MTTTMIDADALLATLLDCDDELDIDQLDLTILISHHLAETINDDAAKNFLLSYDCCPIHHCDIEICRDDNDLECIQFRN